MAGYEIPIIKDDGSPPESALPRANFSDVIDAIGMGPFQRRLVIMCGMGWVIDAMEILVVAFVMEDIAITFHLSSFKKGLIGSASFFGMLIGAAFWTIYADKRGRRNAFVASLLCVFVGGLASAVAPSLLALCICRVVVGFGVGGNLPVTSALVTEFLPTKDRGDILCRIAGTFWGVGVIVAALFGLLLTNVFGPGQEEAMWRWYLAMAAMPSAVVAVAYRLLPESPRFLNVMGKHDEAMQVLENVARVNGRLDVLGLDFAGQQNARDTPHLSSETQSADQTAMSSGTPLSSGNTTMSAGSETYGGQKMFMDPPILLGGESAIGSIGYAHSEEEVVAEAGDVRELFHTPILRRVTLCVWMVWLFLNLSYYGVTFLLPRYYDKISGGQENFVFILTAFVGVTFIPGGYLAMWLCAEHRLGRVGTLKWGSFVAALGFVIMGTTIQTTSLFVVTSLFTLLFQAVPGTVVYVIIPELYTTKYRAVGLGSASVVTRLGGLVAPVLAEVTYDRGGPIAPLLIFGPMMIIAGIFAALIPVETAGRKLDDDSWDRRGPVVGHTDDCCETALNDWTPTEAGGALP